MIKNANCPKDQYMEVKTAFYRGLSGSKACELSDDYSCEVDVTCLVKKQCDGQHECSITVNSNLLSGDLCPGLTKYLYLEYQCADKATSFIQPCGKQFHDYIYRPLLYILCSCSYKVHILFCNS